MENDYLRAQKEFWNVDERTARFGRVDTVSRTEEEYERLADRDIRLVMEDINSESEWTILEIGCGVGRLLSRLVTIVNARKVIGVDISESMISYARTALEHLPNIEVVVNTGADLLVVPNSSVDFVYSNDVFIHIDDVNVIRSYLRETSRVLKARGLLRFNVRRMDIGSMFSNSPGGLLAKVGYTLGFLSPLSHGTAKKGFSGIQYRKRDIRNLTNAAGLSVVSIKPFDGLDETKFWCTCRKP